MARIGPGDFELTMDELRVVARYAAESAEDVLGLFEEPHPDDHRPRAAIEAAWTFVNGNHRSKVQRFTALDAHRAAHAAVHESAKHAGHAAGDAAAAAYLHPLSKATQVGHILRAAA
ncbi:MAG: exonuclease SbcC, partial [Pseudonocardia sp.]|nr:exonuclease SbcC [Pseudonocardia sp.]